MNHFAMLASHEQLVEIVLHIDQWTQGHIQSRIYETLCGPLDIPGGPRWELLVQISGSQTFLSAEHCEGGQGTPARPAM